MPNNQLLKKFNPASWAVLGAGILLFLVFLGKGFPSGVDSQSEEEIEFIVGELKVVKVYSPTRVAVADPTVADIDKIEGDETLLSAKKAGNTSLTIWDKYGERTVQIRVYAEDLDKLKKRLTQLLANFAIKDLAVNVSKEEGKVILLGEVLSEDKKQLDDVLAPLSDNIINLIKSIEETALVQIDMQVLELSKSASEELGVSWLQALQLREEPYSASTSTTGIATTLNKIDTFDKIFKITKWSRDALNAKLNMLVTQGKGKVLSRPKLVCLSGKEAEFLVGGEIPVVTTAATSVNVSTNVEFRKYGINLKIKPVVRGEEIDTTINTEVSDVDWANAVTVSGARIPAFASRSATTQLYLKDGQTVFLAGLIKNKDSTNISGIPWLKDVPILGALFRSKSFSNSDTELVISVTPTIVKTGKSPTSIGSANLKKVAPVDMAIPPYYEEEVSSVTIEGSKDVLPADITGQEFLPDSITSYARAVQEKIAEGITFPKEAERYKWQGVVKLGLRILPDGSLKEAFIKETSGYSILDENALAAAKKQAPFFAFPPDVSRQELFLEIPVVYQAEP